MKENNCIACMVQLRLRNVALGFTKNPLKHTCSNPINVMKEYGYKMVPGHNLDGNAAMVMQSPKGFPFVFGGKFKRRGNLKEYIEIIEEDIVAWEAWYTFLVKLQQTEGPIWNSFYFYTAHDGSMYCFDIAKGGYNKADNFKLFLLSEIKNVKRFGNTDAYKRYNGVYRARTQPEFTWWKRLILFIKGEKPPSPVLPWDKDKLKSFVDSCWGKRKAK